LILLEPRNSNAATLKLSGVRKLMDDHLNRGRTMTGRLWRLLMFELWHRNFLEKFVRPAGLFTLPVGGRLATTGPTSAPVLASAPAGE